MSEAVESERRSGGGAVNGPSATPAPRQAIVTVHDVPGQAPALMVYRDGALVERIELGGRMAEQLAWRLLGAAIARPR